MRAKRPGVIRQRSPHFNTKTRGDQRSEWYLDSYPIRREERAQRPLRSFSPPQRENLRRVLGKDQRAGSVERRDYSSRHFHAKRDNVRARLTFEGNRQMGNREIASRAQFDEDFLHRDSPSVDFQHKYVLSDSADLNMEANAGSKHVVGSASMSHGARSDPKNNDNDFHTGPGNGPTLDGHRMLVQKSVLFDDGSARTFFTLPSDVYSSEAINSATMGTFPPTGNVNINLHEGQDLRHRHSGGIRFGSRKMAMGEPFEEEEDEMNYYPRDSSYPMGSLQSKAFGGSSSGLAKDDFFGSYHDTLRLQPDEFGNGGKFSDLLNHDKVGPSELFDPRYDPELRTRGYSYQELGRRDRTNLELESDELYKKIQPNAHGDYSYREPLRPPLLKSNVDRINSNEISPRSLRDGDPWNHNSLQGESVKNYQDMDRVSLMTDKHREFPSSRNTHPDFRIKASRDHWISHLAEDYSYGREPDLLDIGQDLKGPIHEHDLDSLGPNRSSERKLELGIRMPPERMMKRKYPMDTSNGVTNNRNITRTMRHLNGSDKRCMREDRGGFLPYKHLEVEQPQYRIPGRSFDGVAAHKGSGSWVPPGAVPVRARGGFIRTHLPGGRDNILKRRLGPSPSKFRASLDEKQDSHRPFKFRRETHEDRHWRAELHNVQEETVPFIKPDPPEDSEEFKQQVQRAFLRFSKKLNENLGQQKRYKEQGKAGSLLCFACGSLSKEFTDMHSLVTHAFNSLKFGLRTDHLGLHKAICVLMGWNSLVSPDNAKTYQSLAMGEASYLKEDLILWPPLVIIHDTSVGNKNTTREVLTNKHMEEFLRDMGFGGGKTKVCGGCPANQSILLVKFFGTFSGLQEAERLHKYYSENGRGRKDLQELISKNSNGEGREKKVEQCLYGYMATAQDLDKLDQESKKRCLVKSKKEIEAIAEAPLRTD